MSALRTKYPHNQHVLHLHPHTCAPAKVTLGKKGRDRSSSSAEEEQGCFKADDGSDAIDGSGGTEGDQGVENDK